MHLRCLPGVEGGMRTMNSSFERNGASVVRGKFVYEFSRRFPCPLSPIAIAAVREQMECNSRDDYGGEGTMIGAEIS
jgi:hypothetical protein